MVVRRPPLVVYPLSVGKVHAVRCLPLLGVDNAVGDRQVVRRTLVDPCVVVLVAIGDRLVVCRVPVGWRVEVVVVGDQAVDEVVCRPFVIVGPVVVAVGHGAAGEAQPLSVAVGHVGVLAGHAVVEPVVVVGHVAVGAVWPGVVDAVHPLSVAVAHVIVVQRFALFLP